MKSTFFLIFFYTLIWIVNSLHFLGGTITWRLLNESATGTPVAIFITQTYSWDYSRITCTNAQITGNQLIPIGSYPRLGTDTLDCISNCASGASSYVAPNIQPRCTDISPSIGISVGQRSDTVLLHAGSRFAIAYQDTAWRSLASAASADWSVSAYINLTPRSDNGLFNNAPVATLMSPMNIPLHRSTAIHIPVVDPDGDHTRCRWSTSSNGVDECGGVCPPASLPLGTIIYPNCTIIITGQTVGDWFAVTLIVEDFIDSSSNTALSSVPVQFLVQIVDLPACTTPPKIIGIPIEDRCIPVKVGQIFNSQVIAVNSCGPTVTIADIATLSFTGMGKGNIVPLNASIYYKTLTWTPTTAQIGFQVMCVMAIDSENSQSDQYCFKFYVSANTLCACPTETCTTTTTSVTSTTTTSVTTTTTTMSTTTSTVASSTSTTTTTTTTTTTVSTTTSRKAASDASSIIDSRSTLGLALGLGLPLLLLLSILGLCLCCRCCPMAFCKRLRKQYSNHDENTCPHCQQYRYRSDSDRDRIEESDKGMKDYRVQHMNERAWLPLKNISQENFLGASPTPPSDFGSIATTRITLISSLSNNILPVVDTPVKSIYPLSPPSVKSSDSVLVRTYIDQETKNRTSSV